MTQYDWSKVQVGDKVAKGGSYFYAAEPVRVVKRTPKYLHLENGDKIHVEGSQREYRPWSDDEQAAAERRRRDRDLRFALERYRLISVLSNANGDVRGDDVVRDETLLADLKAAVDRFEAERDAIIARAVAGRSASPREPRDLRGAGAADEPGGR